MGGELYWGEESWVVFWVFGQRGDFDGGDHGELLEGGLGVLFGGGEAGDGGGGGGK